MSGIENMKWGDEELVWVGGTTTKVEEKNVIRQPNDAGVPLKVLVGILL